MPNWKSRSDTEAWWSSQPGNRGKTYPGDDIAEKQYQRNKAAGESNLSTLRNFLFGKSDARKQPVEDAINNGVVLETPYGKQRMTRSASYDQMSQELDDIAKKRRDVWREQNWSPETDIPDTTAQGQTVKKGGRIKRHAKGGEISLKDCKVSTTSKGKKNSNW